jgi:hypothetical protein
MMAGPPFPSAHYLTFCPISQTDYYKFCLSSRSVDVTRKDYYLPQHLLPVLKHVDFEQGEYLPPMAATEALDYGGLTER